MSSRVRNASNPMALSGALLTYHAVLKHNRVTDIATENNLPIIGVVQAVSPVYLREDLQEYC